jgi:hypothetical protein
MATLGRRGLQPRQPMMNQSLVVDDYGFPSVPWLKMLRRAFIASLKLLHEPVEV